jgi:putative CRISPR-associated protein (TIGR02619 family)
MRDILISTVGKSLLANINKLGNDDSLKIAKIKGNLIGLVKELLKIEAEDKTCGAEINSITSIIKRRNLDERNELYLLISDTNEGEETGEILKSYYEDSKNLYKFERVLIKKIEGLTDKDINSFKSKGLKNLVKEIAKIIKENGSERIIINATGGYKAQISFAGLIGQALEIPVVYMFETFQDIILLPPQPISFNIDLWFKYYEYFAKLDKEVILLSKELTSFLENKLTNVLIEEEDIDGEKYIALSPMGQLFHETFKYRFEKEKRNYLPKKLSNKERKPPEFSEHFRHFPPISAETFVNRVWREKEYIRAIRDFDTYSDHPERTRFKMGKDGIILIYSDGTKTAKFRIEIPNANEHELKAALIDLNESYFN